MSRQQEYPSYVSRCKLLYLRYAFKGQVENHINLFFPLSVMPLFHQSFLLFVYLAPLLEQVGEVRRGLGVGPSIWRVEFLAVSRAAASNHWCNRSMGMELHQRLCKVKPNRGPSLSQYLYIGQVVGKKIQANLVYPTLTKANVQMLKILYPDSVMVWEELLEKSREIRSVFLEVSRF